MKSSPPTAHPSGDQVEDQVLVSRAATGRSEGSLADINAALCQHREVTVQCPGGLGGEKTPGLPGSGEPLYHLEAYSFRIGLRHPNREVGCRMTGIWRLFEGQIPT